MAKKLTAPMAICLGETTKSGGKLVRYVGGRWAHENCPRRYDGLPEDWYNASTIQALVSRGMLEYSEWKQGRNQSFPIAAKVKVQA